MAENQNRAKDQWRQDFEREHPEVRVARLNYERDCVAKGIEPYEGFEPSIEHYSAYDYESQKWVQGEPAVFLLIEQTKAELGILGSDRREEYWQMIRDKDCEKSCHEYQESLEELLRSYYNELANNMHFLKCVH